MHAIASDTTAPACIRALFARVTCQIVRTYDDGSEGIINMMSRTKADAELVEHSKRIGKTFASGRTLLAVSIREVA